MAKCFLHKYEDLGSIPRTNVKKIPSLVVNSAGKDRHIPKAYQAALSTEYSNPAKHFQKIQVVPEAQHLRLFSACMYTYTVHIRTHTPSQHVQNKHTKELPATNPPGKRPLVQREKMSFS